MKKIYYLLTFLVMLTVAVRAGAQCAGGMPQCQILVEMHDGYGDGWNNGQLYVYQGTTLRGTVTLNSGSAGESAVSVCSDSVTFVWSSGYYDDEISFVVTTEDDDTLLYVPDASEYDTGDTMGVAMNQCATCPRVSGLQLVSRTHNMLSLAWNASGNSSSWQVEYGPEGFTPGGGTTLTVTTPAATLTGLDSAHWYDVYVTATCGSETASSRMGHYATLCGVNTCDMIFMVRNYNHNGWGGNGIYVVQRGDTVDYVTLTSPYYEELNVPLCHDSVTLIWHQVNEDYDNQFAVYDLSHRLIAEGEGWDIYDGDTLASVMNNCNACPYPAWTDVTNIDTAHATIRWPLTGAPGYVLKLYYNWDSLLYIATTTDTFYTFSSLMPNTEYRVEVASLCGTDTSGWNEFWFNTHAAWMPIIYVTTTGGGEYTGRSWVNAMASTNDACNLAYTLYWQYGTAPEVWVAQGEYASTIYLYPGMHVYGGLVGNEPANYDMSLRDLASHPTVINPQYSNGIYQYNDATDSTACWVDGFTFTGLSYTVANLREYAALRNCVITNNTVSSSYILSIDCSNAPDNSWVSLENCSIVDNANTSSYSTEMIRMTNARAENCLIARNTVRCNVVTLRDSSVLSHCDVVGNLSNNSSYAAVSGGSYSTGYTSRLENSIVWGNKYNYNSTYPFAQISGLVEGYHSAVEGGITGTGNINLDAHNVGSVANANYPKFVAPPTNLQLNGGSACIDAAVGTPATATDIEGNPRVYGSASDIGCYEYQGVDVCGSVIYAQVNEVTSYSARVVWDASHPSYIIYYKEQNASTWDSMTVSATTNSYLDSASGMMLCSVRLTGLTGLTNYEVRLRSVCSGSVSEDYELSFMTACPDVVGYVLVGDTTANINDQGNYFPTQTFYNYSATQQIYLAAELDGATTITQLDFFYTYSSSTNRRLKVYLGHTSMNSFGSVSDVIPESQLTLVYDDYYNFSNSPRMNSIMLTTPFTYNGTDNLVVAVVDSTGSYQYSANKFLTFSAPNRSLYYYRDGSPVNFGNVTFNMGSYCNVLHMPGECDLNACAIPVFDVVAGVTDATIDWAASGTAEMQYRMAGATDYTAVALGSGATVLTGLTPVTGYEVRMRNICGAGDTSRWVSRTFTTLPPNVSRLYVKPTASGSGMGTSWADAMGDIDEALQMADNCYATYGTLCDIWVAEGTYYGDTTRTYAFGMVPGVRVYGGFVGNEPENYDLSQRDLAAHHTVLDGRGQRQVVNLNNSTQRQHNAAINGVTIKNGATVNNGGGVFAYRLDLEYCILRNNATTSSYGGGAYLYYSTVSNCLFYGNNCSSYGGGLYAYSTSIDHCDIVDNSAYSQAGLYCSGYGNLTNTIIWGNRRTSGQADQVTLGSMTMHHCAADIYISGDSTILQLAHANLGTDDSLHVRFASPDDRDYRLMEGSACIDMGTATTTSSNDLSGLARLYGTATDMGCYEYHGEHFCLRPVHVAVSEVTAFSALVSWEGERDTVVFEYALEADSQWTSVTVVGHQKQLMPLNADTRYLVRIKSVCGNQYSAYSDILSFKTACGAGAHGFTLGDPDNYLTTEGNHLPTNAYYCYSYTQSLVGAAELGGTAMNIDTLYYQYIYSTPDTRSLQIYLGETDKTAFASTTDAVPASDLTNVFSGSVTFNNDNTWFAIPLQQTFSYSGANNLVIAVVDQTGSYITSGYRFATHQTDGYKSLYIYSDGTSYNVEGSYSFSSTTYRPNLRIPSNCEAATCPQPFVATVGVTPSTATLRTLSLGPVQMQYRKAGSGEYTEVAAADTVTITGLLQNTTYEVRIRTICGVGDTSVWRSISFTTPLMELDRLYVRAGGAGVQNGTSWENATADFDWAVNTAGAIRQQFGNRPQVWVAEGTYYGDTTAENAFTMMQGVDVYGGFQGNEPANYSLTARDVAAHQTILDGQGARRVLYQSGSFSGDSSIWDGFVITGGRAIGGNNGGGVYLQQGGILANSTITNCRTESSGGGLYSNHGKVLGCIFTADSANTGGAIYNYYGWVENCSIVANQAYYDGGLYSYYGTEVGCLVANNTANYRGGINKQGGNMYGCHVVSNLSNYTSSINTVSYGANLYNTLFWGNRYGGDTLSRQQSNGNGNYYGCAFEAVYPNQGTMAECLLLSSQNMGDLTSPQFVQPAAGAGMDYALGTDWTAQEGSILIDRGYTDSTLVQPATDLAGNSRVQNGRVDIGCYESSNLGLILPEYTGGIIYVTPTGAGVQDGTSWANAMSDINMAVIYSTLCGHPQVWVAEGTYYGDIAADNAFTMEGGVHVYGGFQGNEPATFSLLARDMETHQTILDGQGARRVLYQPSALTSDSSIWDGFVITGGRVTGNEYGGGVYLRQGGILANSTVTNCRSNYYGGGVYNNYGTLRGCTITADSASYGGGVYNYGTIDHCIITANRAANSYGALYNSNGAVSNCLIANNTSNYSYGGVYLSGGTMYNCHVVANLSINSSDLNYNYNSAIYNSLFWGNRSETSAASLQQMTSSSYAYYYNCAFESEFPSGGHNNEAIILSSANTGNMTSPQFVQPAYGAGHEHANGCDWTIQEGSILIDRGSTDSTIYTNSGYGSVTDLAGNPRLQNGRSDIGCYESPYSGITLPEYPDSIIYVTTTGAGLHDGTSWANAMSDINTAITYSIMSGHPSIWVAEGTYHGDTAASGAFCLREGVNMYGGFVGNEAPTYDLSQRDLTAHATILDGGHANRVLNQTYNFSTSTVVDGFVIQNGLVTNQSGAGVIIRKGGRLRNCIVQNNIMLVNNSSNYYGIGVYVTGTSSSDTVLDHCVIRNNSYQNLRTNNYAAYVSGGGIYASNYSVITNCEVYGNSSYRYGGIYGNDTRIYNTVVSGNQAYQSAGVHLYYTRMYNCVVANNTASNNYGGVNCSNSSYIYNSIIWGNKVNYLPNNISGSPTNIYNSAVEGGYANGTNVIDLAATNDGTSGMDNYVRFMDPNQRNYRLHPASHCLDYGDSTYSHLATDLDGNPRIVGGNIDLGAYESESSTTCPSPLNLRSLSITGTSATFAWSPQGTENQWLFTIQGADGTLDSSITLDDTTVTVSGLSLNRNYTCFVRANCGSEYSIRSPLLTITTLCDSSTLAPLSAFTSYLPLDSTVVYNNGVDFSWSVLPEATSYDFYLWKGNAMPTTPTVAGMTTTVLSGYSLPNFERGAYYHWKVVAWNECISRTSPIHTLRINPLPDLHVTSVTHSAPVANQPVTITWTVQNDGEGATPQGATWNDYIWIVSDADVRLYDPNDLRGHLATVENLQGLAPGESYTNSVAVTIPEDFIGNYYLFVFTDQVDAYNINFSQHTGGVAPDPYTPSVTGNPYPYLTASVHHGGQLPETNENDNFFFKVINILPPPSPDLIVTHISHPINAFSNSDITVGWTVTNAGQAIASPKWYDKVYIQMGDELNLAEAHLLATVPHYAGFDTVRMEYVPGSSDGHGGGMVNVPIVLGTPLATDSSYSASATVHIPIQYSGTYTIFVVTDANDAIYESIYEDNNERASQQTIDVVMSPLADLTVTSIAMPATVSPRCTYPVSWTVTNAGASATETARWRDALYLSPTATYDASTAILLKEELHNGVIGIDSNYVASSQITIPATLSGSYYLIVRTDSHDDVFEYTNEDNNTGVSTSPAQVLLPDLIVSSVNFDTLVSVGASLNVQAYIKNIGQGTAYAHVDTRFNVGGGYVNKGVVCNLAPGDSMLVACLMTQPCVSTTQGQLTIHTNWNNNLYEGTATTNNTLAVSYSVIRPDLTATTLTHADTGWSGTTTPVTIALSNMGTVAVNDTVELALYISTNSGTYTANAANRVLSSRDLVQLAPDSTLLLTTYATLPNGIEGNYYLHLVIDAANSVCESNELNNVIHASAPLHVNLSPYPDLIVRNLNVPDTLSVGQTVTFDFSLVNQGIAAAQGNLTTKIFMSLGATYNSAPLIEVATLQQTVDIAVGDTVPVVATGMIPTNANAGFYYFYAATDYTNAFYEHTGEDNNTVRSALSFVQLYPLDLQIDSISGPTLVDWGQPVTYTMTVTNNTTVPTSAQQWVDRLYITHDGALQANMSHVDVNHTTTLLPGESYQVDFEVTIPFGSPSTLYLVGICDFNRKNPDINVVNNQLVKPITVNPVPTPDLQVSDVAVLGDIVSGQPFQLAYTVTNVSETPVASQRWSDRVSLSYVSTLNSTSQQLLLTPKEMALASGESYRDTVEVTVPLPNSGTRYLLVQTNAQLNFYETTQENNMLATVVNITLPPPGDLVVSRIAKPDTVVSGIRTTFQWTVANIGANTISGRGLGSLLYLSSDDVFGSNDRLLGRVNMEQVNLQSGDSLVQQVAARISGVSEGNYYLIVKTDVRNAFYEDNEDNNSTVTTLPFFVKVRELPFNTPLVDTLYNGQPNDYKINVGTHRNETVRIHVESGDSVQGAVNMVYVSHNRVGDNLSYNLSTIGQYTANPELYIPSTRAGSYGVSLYGSTPSSSMQVVTVTADILPFELRSINPTEGGNTGNVTIEMTGSRFRPDMKVWMLHGGDTLFADTLIYSSYYQAFARFNLKGVDTGYYSMGVLNYCEGEAMLTDVFHVTEGSPDGLSYHMVFPTSPRYNRTISMMLEFGNTGNTDIVGAVLEVQSVGGTYIALTPEDLRTQSTVLRIPLTIDGEPEGLLRPGSYGTVTIYGFTAGSLVFAIREVQ
ncbi:MAG: hypothetical protein IKG81_10585 [Bacteroidales bacterium]|nr:hypothetical protein [Bacteroidales bacterium]